VDGRARELARERGGDVSASALAGGYAADLVLGDPERLHPVAGFGIVAERAEHALYAPTRVRGAAYAGALVCLVAAAGEGLARLASRTGLGRGAAFAAISWTALGGRSLARHARAVADLLDAGDVEAARAALPALVGRDTIRLESSGACRAAIESVAENTSDAVVGPLLWGAVAGPAGVAAFRAANTLDAMVGRRDDRYRAFGWASARLDDLLGWPAARAGAALTVACAPLVGGSWRGAWRVLRRDGGSHPSPNAGRMEAAFAGTLGVSLGGPLAYGGVAELRPRLGDGPAPGTRDVRRATRLSIAVGAATAALAVGLRAALEGLR
jgi:adenosylcobinamide-phosphate synthase